MKQHQPGHPGVPVDYRALWSKVGGTLLRFASEDRSLDRDALYALWAESDSRCWMDTEQQARGAIVQGLPPGTTAVPSETAEDAAVTVQSDFAESRGHGQDLSLFESEITAWRDSRHPPLTPVPSSRAMAAGPARKAPSQGPAATPGA